VEIHHQVVVYVAHVISVEQVLLWYIAFDNRHRDAGNVTSAADEKVACRWP